jgi:hypothetical protein
MKALVTIADFHNEINISHEDLTLQDRLVDVVPLTAAKYSGN